eukprot:m.149818 g.149818  ORF g.149818 m.149818 type:complete len:68 (+) comp14208_c0_seq4:65-268(+)
MPHGYTLSTKTCPFKHSQIMCASPLTHEPPCSPCSPCFLLCVCKCFVFPQDTTSLGFTLNVHSLVDC